mgnify:FL=1
MQTEEDPRISVECTRCGRFLMYVSDETMKEKVLASHRTKNCLKLKEFDEGQRAKVRAKVEQAARVKREQEERAKREQTALF